MLLIKCLIVVVLCSIMGPGLVSSLEAQAANRTQMPFPVKPGISAETGSPLPVVTIPMHLWFTNR